ncbi:MAG: phosphoribosylformimino-5-aminoimidazole carboxamide ribotide isomerase [Rickettsiales bacterium]|nr:phosphoribosylformimino-5-aminoimidazole carboxamide ribotide isomerase [Rickettsiales bacterium]|tara:strand:+ start:4481 stop:5257 length:777 start_codon:yes stop_codon:yes gene_type:complete
MTKFRPCIDLHRGLVKQVVGGSFSDSEIDQPIENFVSDKDSAYYANLYRKNQLPGGHIIMLGEGNEKSAKLALNEYPGGMQIGGGITPNNASYWLDEGASHVIVTSYIFEDSKFSEDKLQALTNAVGKDKLVIDLSCRTCPNGGWKVAKDKWKTITDLQVSHATFDSLSNQCAEFLIHAADVEGKCEGIDDDLAGLLGSWGKIPMTYAGGVKALGDLNRIEELSSGKVDVTIGSALDIFGGSSITYQECLDWNKRKNN